MNDDDYSDGYRSANINNNKIKLFGILWDNTFVSQCYAVSTNTSFIQNTWKDISDLIGCSRYTIYTNIMHNIFFGR